MRPPDGELDRVAQSMFPWGRRKELQSIARHRAIVPGAFDLILERAMFLHRRQRELEIAVAHLALFQCAAPEFALLRRSTRNDSTTGRVIFPSRKSSPTPLPSFSEEPP